MGRQQHRLHGDPRRFETLADFIVRRYGRGVTYIADVAGGQGMLAKLLTKRGYDAEVVDPRRWTMKGVAARPEPFSAALADYYDLIVGLHPDEATRAVATAALVRPTILIPCCNFWSAEKLGRDALLDAIARYYAEHGARCERVTFDFRGPKNIGLMSEPPAVTAASHRGAERSPSIGSASPSDRSG